MAERTNLHYMLNLLDREFGHDRISVQPHSLSENCLFLRVNYFRNYPVRDVSYWNKYAGSAQDVKPGDTTDIFAIARVEIRPSKTGRVSPWDDPQYDAFMYPESIYANSAGMPDSNLSKAFHEARGRLPGLLGISCRTEPIPVDVGPALIRQARRMGRQSILFGTQAFLDVLSGDTIASIGSTPRDKYRWAAAFLTGAVAPYEWLQYSCPYAGKVRERT